MDLFDEPARDVALGEEAVILGAFARRFDTKLLAAVDAVMEVSPLRHMTTPGGHRMSVAMTNCGGLGWVTDRTGYRYDPVDPETGRSWPDMPSLFAGVASSAAERAGCRGFQPDAWPGWRRICNRCWTILGLAVAEGPILSRSLDIVD